VNKVLLLTKVMLKSSSTFNNNTKAANRKKTKSSATGIIVMLLVLGLCVCVPFTIIMSTMSSLLAEYEVADSLLYVVLPVANIAIVVISIFSVVSTFFFSQDNEQLLAMPLKPLEILLSRFLISLLSSYLMVFMFIAPIFIGYGIGMHADILFYLIAIIDIIMIPVIPLALILLISVLVFQTSNFIKHKDLLTYIMTGLILIMAFGLNIVIQNGMRSIETNPDAFVEALQALRTSMGETLVKFMPNAFFALQSLVGANLGSRLIYLLLFVVLSVGILALVIFVSSPIYFRTIRGSSERGGKKKHVSEDNVLASSKHRSSFKSQVITEWRLIIRSPTYFMNLVFVSFIFPVIFFISFGMGANNGEEGGIMSFIPKFQASNYTPSNALGFMLFFAGLIFFASMTMISSTAISRMGKSASFVKYIPSSTLSIVTAKIFWGVACSEITAILTMGILAALGIVPILDCLVLLIATFPVFVLINYLAIFIDAKRPKLEWLNETQAVKNNTNGVIYMFGTWAVAIIFAGIGFIFMNLNVPYSGYIVGLVFFIIGSIGVCFMVRYLKKHENTFFDRLA
jgi:ABC-2 type transport system permease protein